MIKSFDLSLMDTLPSGNRTAISPEPKYPPLNALAVASGSLKYCGRKDFQLYIKDFANSYFFHYNIPPCDDFSYRLTIIRNIDHLVASISRFINSTDAYLICLRKCMSLTCNYFRSFFRAEPRVLGTVVISSKWPICLSEFRNRSSEMFPYILHYMRLALSTGRNRKKFTSIHIRGVLENSFSPEH